VRRRARTESKSRPPRRYGQHRGVVAQKWQAAAPARSHARVPAVVRGNSSRVPFTRAARRQKKAENVCMAQVFARRTRLKGTFTEQ